MAAATNTLVRWSVRLVLSCLLVAIAFAVAVLVVLPRATNAVPLTVLTGSMAPGIPVGSVVLDRPVDPGTLHVGDVATYQVAPGKAEYITHRIVKIDATKSPVMFTFKGDANRGPDIAAVPATAIRGKVWFHVPYLGAIRDALHTKGGLAGAGIVLLIIYALVQLTGGLKDWRRAKVVPELAATGATNNSEWLVLREPADGEGGRPGAPLMILATLPSTAFDGLSPDEVTRFLGGTLIVVEEATFTVRLTQSPSSPLDTISLFEPLEPLAPNEVPVPATAQVASNMQLSQSGSQALSLTESGGATHHA